VHDIAACFDLFRWRAVEKGRQKTPRTVPPTKLRETDTFCQVQYGTYGRGRGRVRYVSDYKRG
jgi:hypothetical protein